MSDAGEYTLMDRCQVANGKAEIDRLRARVAELEVENRKFQATTYCAFCGESFPLDDLAAQAVAKHIMTCSKHPMRVSEARVVELEKIKRAIEAHLERRRLEVDHNSACITRIRTVINEYEAALQGLGPDGKEA